MKKTFRAIAAALLTCTAVSLQAAPLLATQLGADAVAVAGGLADVDTQSNPGTGLATSSAVALSGTNYASAVGLADDGLLRAQSEASSIDELTSAVGTASFTSAFSLSGAGSLDLWIELLDEDFLDLSQAADASLFVMLIFGGTTYADLVLTGADDPFSLRVALPGAGSGTLTMLLVSESSALEGDAANYAQAAFQIDIQQVDEPGTVALLLCAGLMGWASRPRRAVRRASAA